LLVVGNSLPIREVDGFVRATDRGVGVVCQRGANGIDGVLSGAAGAAFAAKKPTLLLVGDVSFAHDLAGLQAARRIETPFVVVILDNDGGRIFDQLPIGMLADYDRPEIGDLWRTPPRLDFEHAVRAFGIPYRAPATAPDLDRVLREGLERRGTSIVHVRASPKGTKDGTLAIWHLVIARLIDEFEKGEAG
jgi:2-succinyl-5-enolpyruvyl-6-hydroxy-3-cyclohexene-1-carboxylate synthase